MNPYESPELYRSIVLAGAVSPGSCKIGESTKRPVKWDVKDAKGQEGATTSRGSSPPAQFSVTFSLLKDESVGRDDFAEWDAFQILIESSTAGKNPIALEIYHPDLQRLGITQVCNAGVGIMVHDDSGGAKVTVDFQEYRPAKKKASGTAKPNPGYNAGLAAGEAANAALLDVMKNTSPIAQAEAELDGLVKEAGAP